MAEKIYVIGHKNPDTDSVCSAIAYADFKNKVEDDDHVAARAGELNEETKFVLDYFGVKVPQLLTSVAGKKVILVDHFESGQVLEGIKEAEIFEVVDHHRIGDLETAKPILYHAEPIGSTATIIAEFYFYHRLKLSKPIAGILLASILSDTVAFKSSTCTEKDKRAAKKLAKLVGVKDIVGFGIEIKKAKASLKGLTAEQVLMSDYKDFNFPKGSVGIGQVEVMDVSEAETMRRGILSAMEKLHKEKGNKLVALMVTNIIDEYTNLYVVGDVGLAERAFGRKMTNGYVHVSGGMSRKKQIAPAFSELLS